MNNLHISYDLNQPGKNYAAVIETIKGMGAWAHVHKSFWHVKSALTAEQARDRLWKVMDSSDTVYVVDATNNAAAWQNLDTKVSELIRDQWHKKASYA